MNYAFIYMFVNYDIESAALIDEDEDMTFCNQLYERYSALPDEEKEMSCTIEELTERLGVTL